MLKKVIIKYIYKYIYIQSIIYEHMNIKNYKNSKKKEITNINITAESTLA